MALTEIMPGVRYVVGPNPTSHGVRPHSVFVEGDVVVLANGYEGRPDSDGDVKVQKVDDAGIRRYLAIRCLTPEAEAAATPSVNGFVVGDRVRLTTSWGGIRSGSTGTVARVDPAGDGGIAAPSMGVKFDHLDRGGFYYDGTYIVQGDAFAKFEKVDASPEVPAREPGELRVGDKVKLKASEEFGSLPGSLRDYLTRSGLGAASAVFTVSAVHDGMVEFSEFDTRGGYYAHRFELVPEAAAPAEQLVPIASLDDVAVGDVLQATVTVATPDGPIPAGTRVRVVSKSAAYEAEIVHDGTGRRRTVSEVDLRRYAQKVVATAAPEPEAPAEPAKPEVGGKVRFTNTYVQGAEASVGDEFEIMTVEDVNGRTYITTTTNSGRPSTSWGFYVPDAGLEILPETPAEPPVITPEHEADLKKIADALLAEATSRGGRWPGVYDQLVAALNPQLTVKLPEREREISVRLGGGLGSATFMARSEDEAKAKALDALRAAIETLSGEGTTSPRLDTAIAA